MIREQPAPDHGARIAVLERDMESIVGNGQPGRLTKVEERLRTIDIKLVVLFFLIILMGFVTGGGRYTLSGLMEAVTK